MTTTVPTQALFRDDEQQPFRYRSIETRCAKPAERSVQSSTPQSRVTRAYREVLGRAPTATEEMAKSLEFVKASDAATSGSYLAWEHLYQALFASAEFRYRS